MPPRGPQRCKYDLTYTFVKKDDASSTVEYPITITADTNDSSRHKDRAYLHLTRLLGIGTVAETRQKWETTAVGVGFANAPWSDWDELEHVLEDLPGVRSLRYDPPRVSNWHPPQFILRVDGGRADAVRIAVEQYYVGLAPVVKNGRTVVVIVNPLG